PGRSLKQRERVVSWNLPPPKRDGSTGARAREDSRVMRFERCNKKFLSDQCYWELWLPVVHSRPYSKASTLWRSLPGLDDLILGDNSPSGYTLYNSDKVGVVHKFFPRQWNDRRCSC